MRKLNSLTYFILGLALLFGAFSNLSHAIAQQDMQTDTSTSSAKIEYDLAFPGILPDNPLYKLKVLRDRLSMILISDPYKRTEFYLMQADKGILAAAILIDKNKIDLANETALKAENNMTLIDNELYRFSQKPDAKFFNKLKTASLKHQEVLNSLIGRLPEDKQKTLKTVLYFSKNNLLTIERFQNKKYYSQ